MTAAADAHCMARALRLAERGLCSTDPNPRVGCVLARDGEIIAEAWHERAGEPHAEPLALRQAGERARGATAYVTLEPCCHRGRTPPCTDALIEAGVTRVVSAMPDPNPQVAGQGHEQLRAAGIAVEVGLMQSQAQALNPGFIRRMHTGRPWVRCKLAMSLDGRTAMASGESRWITGEAARADVQRLRARSSAIVTGIGTVLADDPSLNVRIDPLSGQASTGVPAVGKVARQPLRVVLDSQLQLPTSARLLDIPGRTLVMTTVGQEHANWNSLEVAGAEILSMVPSATGQIDLGRALQELARRECNEVLIEAGPRLAGAALRGGCIDELWVYLAPHLMGDAARGLFQLPGLTHMDERIELEWLELRQIGDDLRLRLRRRDVTTASAALAT
ncbi:MULTISPECIES: bifunctional diaminohydroxyphosphoribosylaminopyrimidine deaminase/5-amino-6-(5-phosphoribosylamino)uracil reductase RibD [Thiorhodovibrio]|uniref:bifunctional diaminohydroxyphosphoribosylaminopyrimidine deaminase/5-amino-6-(5-phosphoribosylamino)uracil reductase RibD n=1 Tax=Thiorhodovibrio TaxID=61593 RepID=UPI0019113527|nr:MULTISPECIES: bifunctional diaminohydroxyphosphoribosylaminopyrimidine deaminase/5-amino-6-(5-phosphoribosylamino)uracil reductase RibD [Thiorhodovibrio]MBK5970576.1 riboflavin biosynthesis protein RibD [Thiorhodovibrio winogradskyi]WPL12799.1 Riboflavin biosynthesis protein RibD [Thiorhodovibrio litoralis]